MTDRERRRHTRYLVFDRLLGNLLGEDLPVRIRDVSVGGFAAETPDPLPADVHQAVRFIAADDWSIVIEARSVYTRPSVSAEGHPLYVTGFSFASAPASDAVRRLLEKVTSIGLTGA
jgi:hypothetical protein